MGPKPKKEFEVNLDGETILVQIFEKSISISHEMNGVERWATVKNDKGVRLYTNNSKSKDLWHGPTVYYKNWDGAQTKHAIHLRHPTRHPSHDITEEVAKVLGKGNKELVGNGYYMYCKGEAEWMYGVAIFLGIAESDIKKEKL